MRLRHDFYTLCPSCETRISLTLAARLQASRHGTTCHCPSCSNDWICIQEWIYRDTPSQMLQPQPSNMAEMAPNYGQQSVPAYAAPATPVPAHTQAPAAMPRPHMLPTFQPPQRVQPPMPTAQQHVQPGIPQPAQETPPSQPAPAPHAWSFERQPQATKQSASSSQYDRLDN